ncbi:DUF3426 domain-containing protein [Pseudoxanthomonas gei]|nr:DUF3426 domain-containing protein [Pseudoxanthomonas gei]
MFFSCPHCRELVATDRETRQPPELCPRCGGAMQEQKNEDDAAVSTVGGAPSFASFLRGGDMATSAARASGAVPPADPVQEELGEAPAPAQGTVVLPGEKESSDASDAIEAAPVMQAEAASPVAAMAMPQPPAAELSREPAPSFMRSSSRAAVPRTAKWQWVAVFALAVMLMTQVLVADRARLAADAGWRPLVLTLCNVLGCSVPDWHQPGAISMLSRDVSPIAGSAGGLNVRATFRNDARWPQPWPVLLLSLSDADGRVLGSRAFLPGEYLGAEATQTALAPGQSARIALQLREPNPDVVAFSFDFR